eukprot:TRINITY_DN44418_c0_g1_i1.p2 TRINITY_DN44418_c0_g1~~TRINITY_DN44418_c0_g1_i1.p2  ORF type:complete len:164 (-),score=46.09 TRINITY_DN44418_c0_g1_i1:608-1099(-)
MCIRDRGNPDHARDQMMWENEREQLRRALTQLQGDHVAALAEHDRSVEDAEGWQQALHQLEQRNRELEQSCTELQAQSGATMAEGLEQQRRLLEEAQATSDQAQMEAAQAAESVQQHAGREAGGDREATGAAPHPSTRTHVCLPPDQPSGRAPGTCSGTFSSD